MFGIRASTARLELEDSTHPVAIIHRFRPLWVESRFLTFSGRNFHQHQR